MVETDLSKRIINVQSGETQEIVFADTGDFNFKCAPHEGAGMKGVIHVQVILVQSVNIMIAILWVAVSLTIYYIFMYNAGILMSNEVKIAVLETQVEVVLEKQNIHAERVRANEKSSSNIGLLISIAVS